MNNASLLGGALLKYRAELPRGFALDTLLDGVAYARGLAGTVNHPTSDALEQGQRFTGAVRLTKQFEGAGELEALAWGRHHRNAFGGGSFSLGVLQKPTRAREQSCTTASCCSADTGSACSSRVAASGSRRHGGAGLGPLRGDGARRALLFDGALTLDGSRAFDRSGPFTGISPKLGVLWQLPRASS